MHSLRWVMVCRRLRLRPGRHWEDIVVDRGCAYRGDSCWMRVYRGMRRVVSVMRDCRREVGLGGECLVFSHGCGDRVVESRGLERCRC